jgi:hypothetical protein
MSSNVRRTVASPASHVDASSSTISPMAAGLNRVFSARAMVGSGDGVGVAVGAGVGVAVGAGVGVAVGADVGVAVGAGVGVAVGAGVGVAVGSGVAVGASVGVAVGSGVGVAVDAGVGVNTTSRSITSTGASPHAVSRPATRVRARTNRMRR